MNNDSGIRIIYDGECPFCNYYVQRLRLQTTVGKITLIDARTNPEARQEAQQLGFTLNDGMLVELNRQYFHGAAAVEILARLSSRHNGFNRLHYYLLRHPPLNTWLYPFLRSIRNLSLRLLGKTPLET